MDYQLGPGPLQVDQNTIDEKIKGDIGIVENGDVATHTIPNGYYVIWKGDLYIAKTNISSGTTLSAESNGNLTAKPNGLGGEVAALNSKIAKHTSQIENVDSGTAIDEIIYNNFMVFINFTSASRTWAEGDQIGIVPSGLRPQTRVIVTGNTYQSNISFQVKINTDGKITYESQTGFTGRITFAGTYMI